jgi:Resolvase, N terminal domain
MPAIGAGEVSAAGTTTSATYAVTSAVAATASQRRLRRYLSYDPYGLMYRNDDPDFAAIVDRTFSGLAQSRDLADLYNARGALVRILSSIDRARRSIVYKADRLTRSLADFARLVELFDAEAVSFVSVTQQFNTTSSMGRLTLNMSQSIDSIEVIFHPTGFRRPICVSRRQLGGRNQEGARGNEL